MNIYIETQRLILRDWAESDFPIFTKINSDPKVMEFFPKVLNEEESLAFVFRIQQEFQESGFGLYAVEREEDHCFIGYTGLHHFSFNTDFAPGIEIGWRWHMPIGEMDMHRKRQRHACNMHELSWVSKTFTLLLQHVISVQSV